MKTKIVLLAMLILLFISPASAYTYWINGTTYRSDTGAVLGTVYIYNNSITSNTSSAGGGFSLCCFTNNTNGWNLTAQFNGTDSYVVNRTVLIVNAANLSNIRLNLTPKTPAISGVTESGVTKSGATISWTSNVSNVGNKLTYSLDSGLASNTFDLEWSNSTTTPSYTLSNLRAATIYYYRATTTNRVNSAATYTTTSTGSFTTGHGYVKDEIPLEAVSEVITKPKPTAKPLIDFGAIIGGKGSSDSNKRAGLLVAIIIIGGIVAYTGWAGKGKSKPPTKRRNK